ncbi:MULTISPECIES: hypothetical protein [unclassified Methanosarcina]|nr:MULTISPECIES: hypothetical protein [unclassified Methanosarcina]
MLDLVWISHLIRGFHLIKAFDRIVDDPPELAEKPGRKAGDQELVYAT